MVMGLRKEKALKLLDGRVWEMHAETCQRTVGRKLKMLSLALVQDMHVVKIHVGGDQNQ